MCRLVPHRVSRLMVQRHHFQQEILLIGSHISWTNSGHDCGRNKEQDQSTQGGKTMLAVLFLLVRKDCSDGDILASSFTSDTQVAYILSLGVVKEFRKQGIGSLLLESLKSHISSTAQDLCKALYLHVLTTNSSAIRFYENRHFHQHHYLPYYYSIRGVLQDAYTYVLYLNGGHPPWTALRWPVSAPALFLRGYTVRLTPCCGVCYPGLASLPRVALSTVVPCDHRSLKLNLSVYEHHSLLCPSSR
ncbi:hypothetical protein AB205_0185560 [Aquarana catesbeiana]|uniref:N-alpha-acetyltransferase 60 n=1 Tax=Aquarana catesbeiana TaxID=8400 RepID=A0A2G9SK11_AQUCT|nr:hypothetical protein AB205_0185560 [Aquarana catesbeiana]